jgi:hypothetical protein
MNADPTRFNKIDRKVLLSSLWVVVMINMLKADILSLYIPGTADELARTAASTGASIPQLMLGGAIMMEISIVMILLSLLLRRGLNRWVNMAASVLTIGFVTGGGAAYPHYIFIAAVEVMCLLLIFWLGLKWPNAEDQPYPTVPDPAKSIAAGQAD